jgi:hydroxymethylpyrimidine kinase/phosphomethylpyrimidine kinase/thiamine-phosphate diphosphorylase
LIFIPGTFVNYYGLALRYENEFFRAHAMNVPRDEEDAPSYLVVDFDDTCTVHDTLHFIAKAASMNALERTSMNEMEVYKELVSYYLQDRRSALDAFYSENGKMPHNQRLDRLMDDLSRYELESNDRSFKSLIGAGATLETIRAVARDVRFAPNCINTLIQAQKECGMHVVVLSVNWSSELIGYAFENHGMAVKLVSSFSEVEESSTDVIHVLANRMEFEDGVTTGYIERICETVNDKKEIMRGMGPHSRRIYVGDSLTDIGALLLDGVEGILFGQKELVINVLENIEVDMVPLRHYAVHDKESSMERPHVYQTSSWDELYGFLHAVTGDAPMSSEHLFDIPKVLLISGSDSGGGAGMQADIKTCVACHAFPLNTVTAVTSQNSHGVHDIHTVPAKQIRSQIRAVESDIGFSCIKIGMLGSVENVKAVAEEVQHLRQQRSQWTPLVVDPVLISSSGSALATQGLESALKEHIFPISTIITPNIPEASALLGGMTIDSVEAMKTAATVLYAMGPQYVLIKGGHLNDSSRHAVDVLYDGKIITEFSKPLLQCENTHGTGCSLSSAIASYIAAGDSVVEAVEKAKHFVWRAMERSSGLLIGTGRQKAMNITHTVHDWMACYSSDRVPNDIDLTLYAVSSPNTTSADKTDEEILQQVESVIQGGATVIQIRDKVSEGGRLTRIVSKVVKLCRPHGVKVIVNDRVDVCLAADACGVHVGQNDIDARVVRKMVGPDKILGVSCKTVELALKAQRDGADYLGCGAVFDTPTKDSRRIGFDGVRKIKKSVQIPVVAIGGIDASNAAETIQNTGCDGVAVVRAIFDATDIQKSTALLREVVGRSIAEECN